MSTIPYVGCRGLGYVSYFYSLNVVPQVIGFHTYLCIYEMPRTSEPLLESSSYQRDNDIKRSFSNSQQFIRWSLSALSIILLFIVFRLFEKQGSLTPAQINTFNVVSTALQLLLSLGFFVCRIFQPQLFCFTIQLLTGQQDAFKDLAKVSRWRLLDLSGWDDGEKALLAQIAKWTAVLKLGAKSRAKRWVLWACASWVSIPTYYGTLPWKGDVRHETSP